MSMHDVGLHKLLREPERLRLEAERISADMETLISENYRVFVENLTCSVHLRKEDKKLQDIFCGLVDHVDNLNKSCVSFKDVVHDVVFSHKRIRRTLQCHLQLLELLELPQLVESCSRNGSLDEALELATFVKSLERRHLVSTPGKSSVIRSIVEDVSKSLVYMRRQLMLQLAETTPITKQVYIVATMRKLDGILNEGAKGNVAEMRRMMDYLEARTVWITQPTYRETTLSSLETTISSSSSTASSSLGSYGKAVELLESRRTSLYTVITQFCALFSEIDPFTAEEILRKWVSHHVALVLKELNQHLQSIVEGSAVKALLEQAVYFAKRLADEGADFTPAIIRLFSHVLRSRAIDGFSSAMRKLHVFLENHPSSDQNSSNNGFSVPLYLSSSPAHISFPATTMTNSESSVVEDSSSNNAAGKDIIPPSSLLSFPPLCYYLNAVLSTFNYLRSCPLLSNFEDLKRSIIIQCWEVVNLLVDKASFLRAAGLRSLGTSDIVVPLKQGNKSRGGVSDGASNNNNNNNANAAKLDILYAEAVAFNLLPHVLLSFLLIFRKIDVVAVSQLYDSCHSRYKAGDASHLLNNVAACERIFGAGSAMANVLVAYWRRLSEYKLITEDFLENKSISS